MAVALSGCFACQSCMNLGCPAMIWSDDAYEGRRKVKIDAGACIGCALCAQVCPSDCIQPVASMNAVTGRAKDATAERGRATLNVMVVGVGGQGVLLISKALALIGQKQGFEVKQSEVHGMAKRGGVVFSHVRFGAEVWSPTIAKGEADALIALEWAEGLRWLELSSARHRPLHRRHPPHRAAVRLPRPPPRRADPLRARDAGRDRRQCRRKLRARRDPIADGARRAARRQHRAARRPLDVDGLSGRGLARHARRHSRRRRPRDQPRGVRGRPRLGGSRARRSVAALRRRRFAVAAHRPRTTPRRRVARDQRRLVQGLRHLREAVPGALPGADAEQVATSGAGGVHRLPRLRMAVPGFRHLASAPRAPEPQVALNVRRRQPRCTATAPARSARSPPDAASSPATRSPRPPRSPRRCRASCRASTASSCRWKTRSARSPP